MDEKLCFAIPEFLKRASIGRSTFYDLCARGEGPRLLKIGKKTLVSAEAATEWLRRLEASSEPAVAETRERMRALASKRVAK